MTLPAVIPQEQKSFFAEQGYLVIEEVLTAEEVSACQAEVVRLHKLAAELESQAAPTQRDFQREPYALDQHLDGLPILRKIENTGAHSNLFRQLAGHPQLVQAVQNLIGEDLLLFRSTLMLKPALHGSIHALHQDSAYWPMDPPALVTASIALNHATLENGCFKVVPGSHKWGLPEWGRIQQQQDGTLTSRKDIDLSGQIDVPLKAGSTLLFHSLMVHGSGPNTSPQSRNTALYAYFSPQVHYIPEEGAPRERTFPVIAGMRGRREHTLVAPVVGRT